MCCVGVGRISNAAGDWRLGDDGDVNIVNVFVWGLFSIFPRRTGYSFFNLKIKRKGKYICPSLCQSKTETERSSFEGWFVIAKVLVVKRVLNTSWWNWSESWWYRCDYLSSNYQADLWAEDDFLASTNDYSTAKRAREIEIQIEKESDNGVFATWA